MAAEKEEIILEFTIDQGAAFDDLTRVRKSMELIKQEQKELQKAYQKGTITLEEYVEEQVRQEQILKKEQKSYAELTKVINTNSNSLDAQKLKLSQLTAARNKENQSTAQGVKNVQALDKQILKLNQTISKAEQKGGDFRRSVGSYSEALKNAAGNITIAGTNIGSLTTQLSSFVNPATAAIGILTALGTAYAKSTSGAKDLEFAQSQLSIATQLVTNAFADMINVSDEDGQGLFSRLTNEILERYLPAVAAVSKQIALSREALEDFGRTELEIRAENADRLEENQELLTFIADEQNKLNDKLNATNAIEANLINNRDQIVDILQKQLKELENQLSFDKRNEALQTEVLKKRLEIQKVQTQTTKQIEKNNKLQDDLNRALAEEIRLRNLVARQGGRSSAADISTLQGQNRTPGTDGSIALSDQAVVFERAATKLKNDQYNQDARNYNDALDAKRQAQQLFFNETSEIFRQTSELFQKGSDTQRSFAFLSIATDTAEAIGALTAASEQNPANGFTFGGAGILQYAAGLVRIFSNVAAAKELLGFESGGYTGDGPTKEAAGVVHRREVVWNAQDVAMAGGPHVVNQMRPTYGRRQSTSGGYYDGGVVTAKSTSETNQAVITANALKQMPSPVVSVVDINRGQKKVKVKQSLSKI